MSNSAENCVPLTKYSLLDADRKNFLYRNKFLVIGIVLTCISLFVVGSYVAIAGVYEQLLYPKSLTKKDVPSHWLHRAQFYNSGNYGVNNNSVLKNVKSTKTEQFKLVCYYSFPSGEGLNTNFPGILLANNIDPDLCTHINIGFASVVNNSIYLSESQKNVVKTVIDLKKENSNLKVLLSVGGAGNADGFAQMVLDHANRKSFIKSIDFFVRQYKLDGIDLDWEFPNEILDGDNRQKIHFSQLLYEIRMEINRQERHKFLLSVAVAAPPFIVDNSYNVAFMNKYVDYVNLMSYDYHFYTRFTPFTGLNAPLYAVPNEIGYFNQLNINYSANYWNQKGMAKDKIIIGLPTYGHSFKLLNINNNGIGAPAQGYGNLGGNGFIDYSDACWFLSKNQIKPFFDMDTKSPYATKFTEWISYDDQTSLTFKAEYIKNNNFGGAMVLSLNTDDHRGFCKIDSTASKFPLTNKIKNVLSDKQL